MVELRVSFVMDDNNETGGKKTYKIPKKERMESDTWTQKLGVNTR